MRPTSARLILLVTAAITVAACIAGEGEGAPDIPAAGTEPSPSAVRELLVVGDWELTLLSLPGPEVKGRLSAVTDAVLLPGGGLAAITWSAQGDGKVGVSSLAMLDPETLEVLDRVSPGVIPDVIGPNPASGVAASGDGRLVIGTRWPGGMATGYDVQIWVANTEPLALLPGSVALPGCGVAWPFSTGQPTRFTVVCANAGDVRFVAIDPDTGDGTVDTVRLPLAWSGTVDLNQNPLHLDQMLGVAAATDGTLYLTQGGGELVRAEPPTATVDTIASVASDDRYLPGVAAISPDGDTLYVGSGPLSDREHSTGRRQADRLHAIDLRSLHQPWKIDSPQPFTHLAASPDGTLYATYFPHGDPPTADPALIQFDLAEQTIKILTDHLDASPGPIVVLP